VVNSSIVKDLACKLAVTRGYENKAQMAGGGEQRFEFGF
jgi:hypothetical protein